jgi:SAM-dependent methyltransferase
VSHPLTALDSEPTTCPLCGPEAQLPLPLRGAPRFVACRGCGLVYQTPRPTLQAMTAFYGGAYYEHGGGVMAEGVLPPVKSAADFSERSRAVASWLGEAAPAGKPIVEIGCGSGEHLAALATLAGRDVAGIEPSRFMAAHARKSYGLEVTIGGIDDAPRVFAAGSLGGIVLAHVLEHLHAPVDALAGLGRLLAPGGRLLVEVPNLHAPHPKKRLRGWFRPEHLYYFSPDTLTAVLARAGLEVERLEARNFVRVLARPATGAVPVRPQPARELARMLRGFLRHELAYWPAQVKRRVIGADVRP